MILPVELAYFLVSNPSPLSSSPAFAAFGCVDRYSVLQSLFLAPSLEVAYCGSVPLMSPVKLLLL